MLKENIMIYILTGIAKSGKSLVANRLIQKYSLPTFSTDYIMMMLVRGNKTLGIDPDGEDEIVANQLRPYINGLIQTMVENKVDYFIEGVHFNPDFARELLDKYPNDVKVLYLGYKDINVEDKINELERFIQFSICNYKELLNFTILKNPNIYVDQSEYFGEITVKG